MKRNTTTPRRGRPTIPPQQRKSMMLCARIDQKRYRTCVRASNAAGMRLPDWIRDRLRKAAQRELATGQAIRGSPA